jgi:hypothetical protein
MIHEYISYEKNNDPFCFGFHFDGLVHVEWPGADECTCFRIRQGVFSPGFGDVHKSRFFK